MKRKKAKRTNSLEILSVDAPDVPSDSEGVVYVRVGDALIPTQRLQPVAGFKPFSGKDQFGRTATIDTLHNIVGRVPFQGIDVPDDVGQLFERDGGRIYDRWKSMIDQARAAGDRAETEVVIGLVRWAAINAVETGFYLALLRYADDLKSSVEASAILEGLKNGRRKGTETTKRKAEPRRMAVRRRFRELRKSGFNKGTAREEIQQEYRSKGEEISVRQLERYTEGLS